MAPSPHHSSSQLTLWATWIITSAAALCSPSFFAGTFGDTLQTICIGAGSNLSQLIVKAANCQACLSSWAPRRTEGSQWRTIGLSGMQTVFSLGCRQLQTWVKAQPLLKPTSLMLTATSDLKSEIWARFFFCAKQKRLKQQQSASHIRFCLRTKVSWVQCTELQSLSYSVCLYILNMSILSREPEFCS